MLILLVSATEMEINEFLLSGISKINKDITIETLITGIGIAASMFEITKTISNKRYNYVIQVGIAGTFTEDLKLGEVVFVEKDCFAEMGVEENDHFKSFFETGLIDGNEFPNNNGWLINNSPIVNEIELKGVNGVTINKLSDQKKQRQLYKDKFSASVESMEGASLHYACLMKEQPFIQIRSISNNVGERDKSKWEMKQAITNLNKELVNVLNKILKTKEK